MSKKRISARRVVITSFIVDLTDILLNLFVAILSGSVIVLSEALQGAADLITSGLLWAGVSRSQKRADKYHWFGYGRELFFWILLAGISMLFLTAGLSFSVGLERFLHPHPIRNMGASVLVLLVGFTTNLYALSLSLRRLGFGIKNGDKYLIKIARSSLIESKSTLILDLMGTSAAFLGLIALGIYQLTGDFRFDGLGAMVIGAVSAVFAILLIVEAKELIIGRSASPEEQETIRQAASEVPHILDILDLRTMLLGSEGVLVNMEVSVSRSLTTRDIEMLMDATKLAIKKAVPHVKHIQIEIETPKR